MLHIKLLMQRLVYVPWLLAAGLVLGWSGEAAAQTLTASFEALPASHDGSEFTFELHFSEEIEMSFVNLRGRRARRDRRRGDTGAALGAGQQHRLGDRHCAGAERGTCPISLPPTVDCAAASAVCTADNRALSSGLAAICARIARSAHQCGGDICKRECFP